MQSERTAEKYLLDMQMIDMLPPASDICDVSNDVN